MSDLWLASHLVLWVLVLVQGAVILALMRQVGTLLLRVGSATPFDVGKGPAAGDPAPWLPTDAAELNGRGTLLVFISTGCGACDALVPSMNLIQSSYSSHFKVFGVGREAPDVLGKWAAKRGAKAPIVTSPNAFELYEIQGTPYAFAVDALGRVQARGGVNHTEQLESLLRECAARDSATNSGDGPTSSPTVELDQRRS